MLTNGQNYDIISQNYDGESTIGEIFERADDGGNSVRKLIRKTLRSLRKKAVLVIRTARSLRKDGNEEVSFLEAIWVVTRKQMTFVPYFMGRKSFFIEIIF